MQFRTCAIRNIALAFACALTASHTHAALISLDYVASSGDNWITRDSASGLDWLDVPLTANQTYDQVRTGMWYQRGFRHATQTEVRDLFLHAGTPDDNFDVSTTWPSQTLALAQLLGPTLVGGTRVTTMGFTGTDYFGNDINLLNHPVGSPFTVLLGKVDYLGPYGEAHFSGGHPVSTQAGTSYGSFLVRTVPEPSTSSIMLIAGLAMAAGRIRQSRTPRSS